MEEYSSETLAPVTRWGLVPCRFSSNPIKMGTIATSKSLQFTEGLTEVHNFILDLYKTILGFFPILCTPKYSAVFYWRRSRSHSRSSWLFKHSLETENSFPFSVFKTIYYSKCVYCHEKAIIIIVYSLEHSNSFSFESPSWVLQNTCDFLWCLLMVSTNGPHNVLLMGNNNGLIFQPCTADFIWTVPPSFWNYVWSKISNSVKRQWLWKGRSVLHILGQTHKEEGQSWNKAKIYKKQIAAHENYFFLLLLLQRSHIKLR